MKKISNPFSDTLYELVALIIELVDRHQQMLFILKLIPIMKQISKNPHFLPSYFSEVARVEFIAHVRYLRSQPQPHSYLIKSLDIPSESLSHLNDNNLDFFGYVLQIITKVFVCLFEYIVVELLNIEPGGSLECRCYWMPVYTLAFLV